jgi:hypothetical protein
MNNNRAFLLWLLIPLLVAGSVYILGCVPLLRPPEGADFGCFPPLVPPKVTILEYGRLWLSRPDLRVGAS